MTICKSTVAHCIAGAEHGFMWAPTSDSCGQFPVSCNKDASAEWEENAWRVIAAVDQRKRAVNTVELFEIWCRAVREERFALDMMALDKPVQNR